MDKNTQLILAGSVGVAIIFGFIVMRNYFLNKNYEEQYEDFHRNFK